MYLCVPLRHRVYPLINAPMYTLFITVNELAHLLYLARPIQCFKTLIVRFTVCVHSFLLVGS